jgi:hypothetical protein
MNYLNQETIEMIAYAHKIDGRFLIAVTRDPNVKVWVWTPQQDRLRGKANPPCPIKGVRQYMALPKLSQTGVSCARENLVWNAQYWGDPELVMEGNGSKGEASSLLT